MCPHLTHAIITALSSGNVFYSCTYPPATRIICMSQSVDATSPPPPGPTSWRHHTFTPHHSANGFLSPCGGTHQGGGAHGHVDSWQRAAPALPSLERERLRHLALSHYKHCPHAERGNWLTQLHTRCCGAGVSTPFYHRGRPYMMAAGPLCHIGGLGSHRPLRGLREKPQAPTVNTERRE